MIVPLGTALTTTALHTPMSHENVAEKLIDKLTKHVYIWLKFNDTFVFHETL